MKAFRSQMRMENLLAIQRHVLSLASHRFYIISIPHPFQGAFPGCDLQGSNGCSWNVLSSNNHAEHGEEALVQVENCSACSLPSTWSWLLPPGHGSCSLLHLPPDCFHHLPISKVVSVLPGTACLSCSTCRSSDPEAFQQLEKKYGDKIPSVLYYNKGL